MVPASEIEGHEADHEGGDDDGPSLPQLEVHQRAKHKRKIRPPLAALQHNEKRSEGQRHVSRADDIGGIVDVESASRFRVNPQLQLAQLAQHVGAVALPERERQEERVENERRQQQQRQAEGVPLHRPDPRQHEARLQRSEADRNEITQDKAQQADVRCEHRLDEHLVRRHVAHVEVLAAQVEQVDGHRPLHEDDEVKREIDEQPGIDREEPAPDQEKQDQEERDGVRDECQRDHGSMTSLNTADCGTGPALPCTIIAGKPKRSTAASCTAKQTASEKCGPRMTRTPNLQTDWISQ